jgi:hypothetical protein
MESFLAVTHLSKQDRVYRVALHFTNIPAKVFTVKGIKKEFIIFDGDKNLQSFKTLTKCYEYIKGITV